VRLKRGKAISQRASGLSRLCDLVDPAGILCHNYLPVIDLLE